jgi:hypothetical protein
LKKFLRGRNRIGLGPQTVKEELDMSEAMKIPMPIIKDDGFSNVDVSDQPIVGTPLRCVDGFWSDGTGAPMPADTTLLALATTKVLQRWQDQRVINTVQAEPGNSLEKLRDELNAQIPEAEWEIGIGDKPRPPWVVSHIVYLLDPRTAEKFTFANSTIGAMRAVGDLKDKVAWMRALRGRKVVAEVRPASKPMPTQYGVKQRPHFEVIHWHELGGNLEATPPQIEGGAPQPGLKIAAPVSSEEMLNDRLKY